ncbi:hypothetical protein HDU88_003582 [Geranomyces variabilis]|nr:hypothetical protein HDU88_003582 [Geranomyces variabilis]
MSGYYRNRRGRQTGEGQRRGGGNAISAGSGSSSHSHRRSDSARVSSASSESAETETIAAPGQLQIPGYYYDAEKNRYFKILPNKSGSSSNQYTVGAIKEKEAAVEREHVAATFRQKQREQLLPRKRNQPTYLHTHLSSFLRERESSPFLFQTSELPQKARAMESMMKYLRVRSTLKDAGGQFEGAGFVMQSGDITDFQVHPFLNEVCVGRTDGSVRLLKFQSSAAEDGAPPVIEQSTSLLAQQEVSEITSITWGHCERGGTSTVVATTLGEGGRPGSVHAFRYRSPMDGRMFDLDPLSYRLVTSKMSVFCSAVNSQQANQGECVIAIGTEGKAVVIKDWEDRNGGTVLRHIPISDKSHVLSQEFDETGTLLFNGCRNGRIHNCDLRERVTSSTFNLSPGQGDVTFTGSHRSSVCTLKAISSNRLVSAAMNGSIYMWDLRNTRSPLLELAGQVNTHTKVNFAIDDYESTLVAAGEDRYMRTWSLRTGDLLSQMPPRDASAAPKVVRFMAATTEEDHPQVAAARSESLLWVANGKDLDIWGSSP